MKPPFPRTAILAFLLFAFSGSAFGQTEYDSEEAYARCFREVRDAEAKSVDLWDVNMYGPILLVNPSTRRIYSNFPDGGGELRYENGVYIGRLPEDINIANTKVHWNGREWAMVMLPLPPYEKDRINLMAHELFHVVQPSFGFRGYSPANVQLDDKNGRITLRLELEALRKALESTSPQQMLRNLTSAMVFREYRYFLFPEARVSENLLELNEGLAEYTGMMVAGWTSEEALYHFESSIDAFVRFPTFVRSFAYETTPVLGYLLRNTDRYWNRQITPQTNLTDFFISRFGLRLPSDIQAAERSLEDEYDGRRIRAEETSRERIRLQQVETYRKEFIDQPHVEITFVKMHLSFDPANVIPLDDKGSVYPTIRVTDYWGILDVQNGALLSPDWRKIIVGAPTKIDGSDVSGDGWTLKLSPDYSIVKDYASGNYVLVRSQTSR